ncbi:transglutaminase domain-containing protein [Ktedonosporobacter rubrisoli]|uniref:Transglutaminase domain-containing protein n=1 Tax=Ktedonosporobacter rubrisoli TaxID=2509675 RepID=A0A4P6JY95_KTERU|nr:transglutaminase domain-containing protein [Ktedonosporobacter rubrisoli]QBD80410.1 transglutaminase domain-containing protein [Ktedonosporobacter rubrisoli]
MKSGAPTIYIQPTPILNSQHPLLARFTKELLAENPVDERTFLQMAHQRLSARLLPVYTLRERQPASITLARGCGSCSQRMAVLEAVARSAGIGTRSHALWLDGQFWSPRFLKLRHFLPRRVLLAWPEFFLDDGWIDFAALYGPLPELADHDHNGFTNAADETLFEAVSRTAVDWYGQTSCSATDASCNLSRFVLADEGIFPSRDAVFDTYGLFIHQPGGCLFELIFGGRKVAS